MPSFSPLFPLAAALAPLNVSTCMEAETNVYGDIRELKVPNSKIARVQRLQKLVGTGFFEHVADDYYHIKNKKSDDCLEQYEQSKSMVLLLKCYPRQSGQLWRKYEDKEYGTKIISKWG